MSNIKINYILFTHLPYKNKDKTKDGAYQALERRAEDLARFLNNEDGAPGMIAIFFDTGWLSLLNTIGTDFDPVTMAKEFGDIKEIEARITDLKKKYEHENFDKRLRLITAKTLYPILNNLRGNKPGLEATRLKSFLVGDDPGVRYDTTKVAEAIIRVRHLGSSIPVIRVDWDALLGDKTFPENLIETSMRDIPSYCHELSANHQIHSYLISGKYEPANNKPIADWGLGEFNTAYATRMFPAMVPTQAVQDMLNEHISRKKDKETGKITLSDGQITERPASRSKRGLTLKKLQDKNCLNRDLMIKYYGLGSGNQATGLPRLGSDPEQAVISGAGLVISEGAILDLPPFSNFQLKVMWIDDYLKYELHRALGHFTKIEVSGTTGELMAPCRKPTCRFYKDRILGGQSNLRPYTLSDYIPTLFWGILVDAWIRGEPPIEDERQRSPFVNALEDALKRGLFDETERTQLRAKLRTEAIKRINLVIEFWSALKDSDDHSFAALWVSGRKSAIEKTLRTDKNDVASWKEWGFDDEWLGWGLLKKPMKEIKSLDDLRHPVFETVIQLIDDMCTYIDWTLDWPKFVQSVRAVRTGHLQLDVSYSPEEAMKSLKRGAP